MESTWKKLSQMLGRASVSSADECKMDAKEWNLMNPEELKAFVAAKLNTGASLSEVQKALAANGSRLVEGMDLAPTMDFTGLFLPVKRVFA